jgi:hypothetical protein
MATPLSKHHVLQHYECSDGATYIMDDFGNATRLRGEAFYQWIAAIRILVYEILAF